MTEAGAKLLIKRRTNVRGAPSVAPFINGSNVWDIPPKHWCHDVEQAILHAYELGWQHCNKAHAGIANHNFPLDAKFEEHQ